MTSQKAHNKIPFLCYYQCRKVSMAPYRFTLQLSYTKSVAAHKNVFHCPNFCIECIYTLSGDHCKWKSFRRCGLMVRRQCVTACQTTVLNLAKYWNWITPNAGKCMYLIADDRMKDLSNLQQQTNENYL